MQFHPSKCRWDSDELRLLIIIASFLGKQCVIPLKTLNQYLSLVARLF